MARRKKPIDYINELYTSQKTSKQRLGEILHVKYNKWVRTLAVEDFLEFNETIMANKNEIGTAQFFGKFRAYSFEEYVYRLLKEKLYLKKPLELFWSGKCLVWQKEGRSYAMEFDVAIGVEKDGFVDPAVVFDTKIELDSSRLKTALGSFAMLKRWKPNVKCLIAYVKRELDDSLLELAMNWADGIFQFSYNNQAKAFTDHVARCL